MDHSHPRPGIPLHEPHPELPQPSQRLDSIPTFTTQSRPALTSASVVSPNLDQQPTYPACNGNDAENVSSQPRDSQEKSEEKRPVQELNIYARPYVPEAWTVINTLPGVYVNTPPAREINYHAYIQSYVGSSMLPPFPQMAELKMDDEVRLDNSNAYMMYGSYYKYHLVMDFDSQGRENNMCALYGHAITLRSYNPTTSVTECSFEVPGLRENHPYVEEDDIIQLRHLRYDSYGRLFCMDQWLNPSEGPLRPGQFLSRRRGDPAPGWTGTIFNARASAIQRKRERLFIMVRGLETVEGARAREFGTALPRPAERFNVQFIVPRERYFPMFQALSIIQATLKGAVEDQTSSWVWSMLYPNEAVSELQTTLNPGSFKRAFFDEQLNWEQKKSVESICLNNYGTLPYLISGPPGTGKTKTLVEIAIQLVKNVDGVYHILFCAPSDPAADTIVERISSHFNPNEVLRLNRPSRTFAEVPGSVLPFCFVRDNGFDIPPFRQLMAFKIVVTTCRDASLLLYSRLTNTDLYRAERNLRSAIHPYTENPLPTRLHWTALLMDESAQATEPEALVPLVIVAPPPSAPKLDFKPLVVMAGDEYQLGPRTSLPASPLKTSLFARLFARPVYADHELARGKSGKAPPTLKTSMLPIRRPAFTNLIRNYRSHPAILAVPSALFYADTLEPEATDTDRLAKWSGWKGKKWPVLFDNNNSDDMLEKLEGGGWYNVWEARKACHYAAQLITTGLVKQNEICIMSPFKAQVKYIREQIREIHNGLWDIDVGPTEAFQGLERGVVILCTTRSRKEQVEEDKKNYWGVIGLPKIMNVALTRAKFGLIVIGKHDLLIEDPDWRAFLQFCKRNGLVNDLAFNTSEASEGEGGITRLEKVLLARERDVELGESGVLRGVTGGENDEMWTRGIQAALDEEGAGEEDEEDEDEDEDEDDEDEDEDEMHPNRQGVGI